MNMSRTRRVGIFVVLMRIDLIGKSKSKLGK